MERAAGNQAEKFHLAVDERGNILAANLTESEVADAAAVASPFAVNVKVVVTQNLRIRPTCPFGERAYSPFFMRGVTVETAA